MKNLLLCLLLVSSFSYGQKIICPIGKRAFPVHAYDIVVLDHRSNKYLDIERVIVDGAITNKIVYHCYGKVIGKDKFIYRLRKWKLSHSNKIYKA
jgi:hypothetical protein